MREGRALAAAAGRVRELRARAEDLCAPGSEMFNPGWQDLLNLRNHLVVSEMIARSALAREESRGSHFRRDFPDTREDPVSNIFVRRRNDGSVENDEMDLHRKPVTFSRVRPDGSVGGTVDEAVAGAPEPAPLADQGE